MQFSDFQILLDSNSDFPSQRPIRSQKVTGGCINECYFLDTEHQPLFIKLNKASLLEMFEKEADALQVLNGVIATPEVLGMGIHGEHSYLILEWIESSRTGKAFWEGFGYGLARQHGKTSTSFGYKHHNFIGSLAQSNSQHGSWYDFFIQERLLPQIKIAQASGLLSKEILVQFDTFFGRLPHLVPDHLPALIHGDLWSGNFLCGVGEKPYVVDPAVHFGHPETEVAFTHMFGGFDRIFYDAYFAEKPFISGFQERIPIHNLYPGLVHLNLFGSSYLDDILSTLGRFA
jgi:fructosamine-3-kinase